MFNFIKNLLKEIKFRLVLFFISKDIKKKENVLKKTKGIKKIFLKIKIIRTKNFLKRLIKKFLIKHVFKKELKRYGIG